MRVAVRADRSVPHASRSHLSAPVVEVQLGLVAPSTKIYTLLNTREHTHKRRLRIQNRNVVRLHAVTTVFRCVQSSLKAPARILCAAPHKTRWR